MTESEQSVCIPPSPSLLLSASFVLYRPSRLLSAEAGHPFSNRKSISSYYQVCNINTPYFSIASFSGDLSSLTAPPFILSPVSLTEFPGIYKSPWCIHYSHFSFKHIGANIQRSLLPLQMQPQERPGHWPSSSGSSLVIPLPHADR